MKNFVTFMILGLFMLLVAPSVSPQENSEKKGEDKTSQLPPGTYAVFNTSMGQIICRLFTDKAPKTTANFIGLAEGTREWKDPATAQWIKRPFYDGLIFHRVIPGFMIQGGCPLGNGSGGPGYKFDDEFHPDLLHNKPGILSMANAGPNTNGSQFFITEAPTPHLNPRVAGGVKRGHAVFGEVVEGIDVVKKIVRVERDPQDKPLKPVVIKKLTIKRIAAKAGESAERASRPALSSETSYDKPETSYGKK
jgi:peptidyl-prolyl cis-trans isomerase A (cyclophilin A)